MKRISALLLCLLFLATATEAVGLASLWNTTLKCPLCKMKMQKIDDCRCHKKKPVSAAKIHDPCGDTEGDFHISFDRVQAVSASETLLLTAFAATYLTLSQNHMTGISTDIPQPPPRQ